MFCWIYIMCIHIYTRILLCDSCVSCGFVDDFQMARSGLGDSWELFKDQTWMIGSRRATIGVQQKHHFVNSQTVIPQPEWTLIRLVTTMHQTWDVRKIWQSVVFKEWTSWCRFGSRFNDIGHESRNESTDADFIKSVSVFNRVEKLWINCYCYLLR